MRQETQQVNKMLRIVVEALVDATDDVQIDVLEGHSVVVFEVFVVKRDIGKIIGKQGATIQSIRRILEGASAKDRTSYIIQVVED